MDPSSDSRDDLRITRIAIETIASVDLGWIVADAAADRFLRHRGRPGWLSQVLPHFASAGLDLGPAVLCESAYATSGEHGRPTFSASFSSSYMPLQFEVNVPSVETAGCLQWSVRWIKVGPTGAVSFRASAGLAPELSSSSVSEVISAYQDLRFGVRNKLATLVALFVQHWSAKATDYLLEPTKIRDLLEHLDVYDVVDFDFTVNGMKRQPKDLYEKGPITAMKQLAGLTRMSRVMDSYSAESAKSLALHDLGNRPDELWIVNSERLTRHHAEQLTDAAKQLFLEDIVLGTELIMQQRATLNYVINWVRATRATYLDQLTSETASADHDDTMKLLLSRVAWITDMSVENVSAERDSSSSFFRLVLQHVTDVKDIEAYRLDVARSVDSLVGISVAVFGERATAFSADLQHTGLELSRSSRNLSLVALVLAVAVVILTVLQVWLAFNPRSPSTPERSRPPAISTTSTLSREGLAAYTQEGNTRTGWTYHEAQSLRSY